MQLESKTPGRHRSDNPTTSSTIKIASAKVLYSGDFSNLVPFRNRIEMDVEKYIQMYRNRNTDADHK